MEASQKLKLVSMVESTNHDDHILCAQIIEDNLQFFDDIECRYFALLCKKTGYIDISDEWILKWSNAIPTDLKTIYYSEMIQWLKNLYDKSRV